MKISVRTVDGREYLSDALTNDDLEKLNLTEDEARKEFIRLFEEFSNLTYLSIEIDGRRRFFNPANVIWAELVD